MTFVVSVCGMHSACGAAEACGTGAGASGTCGAGAVVGCCECFLCEEGLEVLGAEQLGQRALEKLHAGLEVVRSWHGCSTGLAWVLHGVECEGLFEGSVVVVGFGF